MVFVFQILLIIIFLWKIIICPEEKIEPIKILVSIVKLGTWRNFTMFLKFE